MIYSFHCSNSLLLLSNIYVEKRVYILLLGHFFGSESGSWLAHFFSLLLHLSDVKGMTFQTGFKWGEGQVSLKKEKI